MRVALRVLRVRHGSYAKVAAKMSVHRRNVARWASGAALDAGVALEVARLAGVPVDAVLKGEFPAEGSCPYCGRTD